MSGRTRRGKENGEDVQGNEGKVKGKVEKDQGKIQGKEGKIQGNEEKVQGKKGRDHHCNWYLLNFIAGN